jgi:hypothetical protein
MRAGSRSPPRRPIDIPRPVRPANAVANIGVSSPLEFAFPTFTTTVRQGDTLADTACTVHVWNDISCFLVTRSCAPQTVRGLGTVTTYDVCGDVRIHTVIDGLPCAVTLTDVAYIPSAPYKLISVPRLWKGGCTSEFSSDGFQWNFHCRGINVLRADISSGLPVVLTQSSPSVQSAPTGEILGFPAVHCDDPEMKLEECAARIRAATPDVSMPGLVDDSDEDLDELPIPPAPFAGHPPGESCGRAADAPNTALMPASSSAEVVSSSSSAEVMAAPVFDVSSPIFPEPALAPASANVPSTAVPSSLLPPEPTSYQAAMATNEIVEWDEACDNEVKALDFNDTWVRGPLADGAITIGTRWVLRRKLRGDGSIKLHKPRVVARGYEQREGVDFHETFSPVASYSSIRLILALAAELCLHLHCMDVVSAFLQRPIDAIICVAQPEGYVVPGSEHLVCRLLRSLYGLRQSPRMWWLQLDCFPIGIGFCHCGSEGCLCFLREDGELLSIAVYVDDLVIARSCLNSPNEAPFQLH